MSVDERKNVESESAWCFEPMADPENVIRGVEYNKNLIVINIIFYIII